MTLHNANLPNDLSIMHAVAYGRYRGAVIARSANLQVSFAFDFDTMPVAYDYAGRCSRSHESGRLRVLRTTGRQPYVTLIEKFGSKNKQVADASKCHDNVSHVSSIPSETPSIMRC